jgi:hypothetical protein
LDIITELAGCQWWLLCDTEDSAKWIIRGNAFPANASPSGTSYILVISDFVNVYIARVGEIEFQAQLQEFN